MIHCTLLNLDTSSMKIYTEYKRKRYNTTLQFYKITFFFQITLKNSRLSNEPRNSSSERLKSSSLSHLFFGGFPNFIKLWVSTFQPDSVQIQILCDSIGLKDVKVFTISRRQREIRIMGERTHCIMNFYLLFLVGENVPRIHILN